MEYIIVEEAGSTNELLFSEVFMALMVFIKLPGIFVIRDPALLPG